MITVNKETGTIEITETLTYEYTVKPIFEEEFEYLEDQYLIDDVNEDDPEIKQVLDFVRHVKENGGLTDDEINEILENLAEDYDYRSSGSDDNISIFDPDLIRGVVVQWINEQTDDALNF